MILFTVFAASFLPFLGFIPNPRHTTIPLREDEHFINKFNNTDYIITGSEEGALNISNILVPETELGVLSFYQLAADLSIALGFTVLYLEIKRSRATSRGVLRDLSYPVEPLYVTLEEEEVVNSNVPSMSSPTTTANNESQQMNSKLMLSATSYNED